MIPIRITILTSSYPRFPGDGTAPFIQSIAEHLVKLGHDVEVVAPHDVEVVAPPAPQHCGEQRESPPKIGGGRGAPPEFSRTKVHRFRYIWPERWHIMGHARSLEADVRLRPRVYILLPFFILGAFVKLIAVTRAQNTQLIHVHWVLPNGPIAALVSAIEDIPFVVSLHGSDVFVAQRNPLSRAAAKWIFRRASAVTACSAEMLRKAQSLGAPKDTYLLAWGADPDLFHPRSKNLELAHSLGLQGDEINILALGRFVHKKGFDGLVRAFAEIALNHPNARLIIGGEGPTRRSLEESARALDILDQAILPGRIPWDQVPDFLSLGDLFVLPSIQDEHGNQDGLPTVLLEAMACGLPVVASDLGGANLIIRDGDNGLLIPPGDTRILAEALERLLVNPAERAQLGRAARQSVISEHHWDAVAGKLTCIFDEALT
ncbi:MAG: glycosyltransferase family 4 protein [Chloroflexi bacterium]|nr:glycosyltransferase family 4 protein [Chloroflexota bacterium]